jgi:hypothetical protein
MDAGPKLAAVLTALPRSVRLAELASTNGDVAAPPGQLSRRAGLPGEGGADAATAEPAAHAGLRRGARIGAVQELCEVEQCAGLAGDVGGPLGDPGRVLQMGYALPRSPRRSACPPGSPTCIPDTPLSSRGALGAGGSSLTHRA